MTQVSRRRFVTHGSLGIVIAGALAALPGVGALLKAPPPTTAPIELPSGAEPLIVHVSDIGKGEMSIFSGTNQVIRRDADLAARIYNAMRGKREEG